MSWQDAVERTVSGLGYDLVDASISAGGLLRVFIDHLPGEHTVAASLHADRFITVDDCEKVTRQLQHVLEVDNVAYERLEVSSPGLDRPLKKAADFARFVGEQVELTLKLPFEGRKKYQGRLTTRDEGWRLVWNDETKRKPGAQGRGKAAGAVEPPAAADLALDFSLDEVRDAHLVPVVDFKGRRFADAAGLGVPGLAAAGSHGSNDEVEGGRIQ